MYWEVPFRNLLSQGLWAGQNIPVQFFLRFGSLSLGWGEPFPEAHWSGRIERVCVLRGVWKWCGWHGDKLLCNCCSCSTNNHMTMKSLTLFITMHARPLQLWTTCTHACTLPQQVPQIRWYMPQLTWLCPLGSLPLRHYSLWTIHPHPIHHERYNGTLKPCT